MILSRFVLNAVSRVVQQCLYDSQMLHAHVYALFPEQSRAAPTKSGARLLYRLEVSEHEGRIVLVVQSLGPPDVSKVPEHFLDPHAGSGAVATTSLEPLFSAMQAGMRYRFRLRANPARKIDTKSAPDGTRRNGRRVPLRGADARGAWLIRHFDAVGLRLVATNDGVMLRQRRGGIRHGLRSGREIAHNEVIFEGILEVLDVDKARTGILKGIGPAKGYGFGLLSLAPFLE